MFGLGCTMENQEQKNITCKKIAWTITNFTSLKTNVQHYSGDFTLGNCAWRLKIYRGRRKTKAKSLSIYLKVADASSFSQGWSISAAFSLTVVNQVSDKKSRTKGGGETVYKFCANKNGCGCTSFMPLIELEDPFGGYILNDQCIIEVELFLLTLEGIEPRRCTRYPILSKEPNDVYSKDDDVVYFKDLGKIEKSLVPLLEEVCLRRPSLIDCKKNKSCKFTEWAFTVLGRVLQFLKQHKWKDMNVEACEELQHLWEELQMSKLDLSWLEPQIKSALNMKGYWEKVMEVKRLKQDLIVLGTEMNKMKESLAEIKGSIETRKQDLIEAEDGFKEKKEKKDMDLDSEIGYW